MKKRATRDRRAPYRSLITEALHPHAPSLSRLPTRQLVALLLDEEARSLARLTSLGPRIAAAADRFAATLASGGRVIYVGAGTSGRLGVLDAAELPPTFGTDAAQVTALIAGGDRAIRRSVEGAEDRATSARRAIAGLRLSSHDLVLAIAASGVTPFTRAALDEARRRGAHTLFLTFAPERTHATVADRVIGIALGPELVAGSTRLKAGTATKVVLNAISTAAMIRLGKVYRGRMIDVQVQNAKLRHRALGMIVELTGVSSARARRLLAQARGSVKLAVAAALLDLPIAEARRQLAAVSGRLERLVGE